jgi:hypothetical protein
VIFWQATTVESARRRRAWMIITMVNQVFDVSLLITTQAKNLP